MVFTSDHVALAGSSLVTVTTDSSASLILSFIFTSGPFWISTLSSRAAAMTCVCVLTRARARVCVYKKIVLKSSATF